ncbi:uncharacterized protein B0H18DRAFT_1210449 [Fomitopsis serialis]|uniref:uncharacterized protein n=1 Tax=Fomitopsis serialis TaxID=139415 RepID=UPI0020087226|nr:uncharacterized protein B0H18DRAFT_1210449 [Neoantrodia serialis]KAH9928195.1 hypothetical protein B0H18DRAFT_1210449 [Neoantrodia serialis]
MAGPPRRTPLSIMKATSSDNPKVTDTPKLPAHEPDDASKSSSSADTAEQTPQRRRRAGGTVSEFGPEPEFSEELARQWGWTDDSWEYMSLHRLTSRGWVRMREPIDDFERGIMGLLPLPPDVVEVRLEERRKEDLEMLMKRHGVKPQGTCEKCRENGLTCDGTRPTCTACDLWGAECTYTLTSTGDDIRRALLLKMKAEIDEATEQFDKLAVEAPKQENQTTPDAEEGQDGRAAQATCVAGAHPSLSTTTDEVPVQSPGRQGESVDEPMVVCKPDSICSFPRSLCRPVCVVFSIQLFKPSLVSTPVDEDVPMVEVVKHDEVVDAPPPATKHHVSVVQGRDDEAKEAAYALLGLSKAPPKPSPTNCSPARKPQPVHMKSRSPVDLPRAWQIAIIHIPEIVITPPAKELATQRQHEGRRSIGSQAVGEQGPWRWGRREDVNDEDEVAQMLGDLIRGPAQTSSRQDERTGRGWEEGAGGEGIQPETSEVALRWASQRLREQPRVGADPRFASKDVACHTRTRGDITTTRMTTSSRGRGRDRGDRPGVPSGGVGVALPPAHLAACNDSHRIRANRPTSTSDFERGPRLSDGEGGDGWDRVELKDLGVGRAGLRMQGRENWTERTTLLERLHV